MSNLKPQISEKLKTILTYSNEEASRLRSKQLGVEHILLGILRQGDNVVTDLLSSHFEINPYDVRKQLEAWIDEHEPKNATFAPAGSPQLISQKTDRILRLMYLECLQYKKELAEPEHMVLAILKENSSGAATVLHRFGLTYEVFLQGLKAGLKARGLDTDNYQNAEADETGFTPFVDRPDEPDATDSVAGQTTGDQPHQTADSLGGLGMDEFDTDRPNADHFKPAGPADTAGQTPAKRKSILSNFGKDLTAAAEEQKLDPIVGREKETDRIAQILSRRKKNNPILIGEPGVGKSAIAEGLALKIVARQVPGVLLDKRIFTLDIASIVAGTKYRGQFEERMKAILAELEKHPEIIVFIDEIHTLVGAGETAGALDASNILKPALARGEIQCIGATTLDEYRRSIEKDGALERRFQKVLVEPTSPEETVEILQKIKTAYEGHHYVHYTDEAIQACVDYSVRYLTDRFLPDKAIDALDEAGAKVHIRSVHVPATIVAIEERLKPQRKQLKHLIRQQKFEMASALRNDIEQMEAELEQAKSAWREELSANKTDVTEQDVAEVVSMMSGVPIQKLEQSEMNRLLELDKTLQSQIIGQDEAIEKITRAIRRNRSGLKDPNKPIGSFIFLGPTGVGKTYLTKMLARQMFGSDSALIRIDMSEYMEKFAVSRLVGAPPGYVGYEDGGQLTEKVRRKPYSIVLFDEIEKAHPDIFNLLLQVLDEGQLTDGLGRKVDFKNTIIIMTSNLGSRQIKEFGQGVGFYTASKASEKDSFAQGVIDKALQRQFSPEFLNRVDEVVVFHNLIKDDILKILEIELRGLYERVEAMGYHLTISDKAKDLVIDKGWDPDLGARPLQRAIQKYFEDILAETLLKLTPTAGSTLAVDLAESAELPHVEIR